MKAKDVMKLLGITRQTLHNYIVKGYIKYVVKPNGDYEYNDDDVYAFIGQKKEKKSKKKRRAKRSFHIAESLLKIRKSS